jgi:hypothetical protein
VVTLLPEDFLFVSVKHFLTEQGWKILGGEPPNGTLNDLVRITIRPKGMTGRLHSLGAQKVDLISRKGAILLLTEIKPDYSASDKTKLDNIVGNRLDDLMDALWERCKISAREIRVVLKSLAFSSGRLVPVDNEFIYFRIAKDGKVKVERGSSVPDVGV